MKLALEIGRLFTTTYCSYCQPKFVFNLEEFFMATSIRKVTKASTRAKKVAKKVKAKKASIWTRWLHGSK